MSQDEQWSFIEPILPKKKVRKDGKGRPWQDDRKIFNGILWILRTGAPWKDLPPRYPPYQTCHRRFQSWAKKKVMKKCLEALCKDLIERGKIDLSECYIDGSFASAKKGVLELVRLSAVKGPRSWQLQTAMVFLSPLSLEVLLPTKLPSSGEQLKDDSSMKSLKS